ncbi:hypothetical protein HAX54_049531, partial [Datura stramonium]|nr:hypothetical protein [Datura stramonium]
FDARDQGQWRNRDSLKNYRSGVYVPPRARELAMNDFGTTRLEDMMKSYDEKG